MLHLSSACHNLTPMGTVPISVIYGFEYSLNGFDQTNTKTLHKSEERKEIKPKGSPTKKTGGCLKEIKALRNKHATNETTGHRFKTKGCLTDINICQKVSFITSSRQDYRGKLINPK